MFAGLNVPDGPPNRIAVFYDLLASCDGPDGEFVPKMPRGKAGEVRMILQFLCHQDISFYFSIWFNETIKQGYKK